MPRKSLKFTIEFAILEVMKRKDEPLNCNQIKKEVRKKIGRDVHFSTVKNYLKDLVRKDLLYQKELPPFKEESKKGIVLYSKKRFPESW